MDLLRPHNSLICRIFFLLLLLMPFSSLADYVNYTGADQAPNIAEITIANHAIKMILEIDPKNIKVFEPLPGIKLIVDGQVLQARITKQAYRQRIDRQSTLPPPGGKAPSKRVIYLAIVYPLQHRPKQLKIIAPHNQQGIITANIGFIITHRSTQIIDFRYLPAQATLDLDWKDPWYSRFQRASLSRYQKSIMSYLYVEPFEVRHEVVARLKNLSPWVHFDFNKKLLTYKDQQYLKKAVGDLFLKNNQISIDGNVTKPALEQVNFVTFSKKGVGVESSKRDIPVGNASIGIILSYLHEGVPRKVSLDWSLFSEDTKKIPIVVSDPAGPFMQFISAQNHKIHWRNSLTNYHIPTISGVGYNKNSIILYKILINALLFLGLLLMLVLMRRHYIRSKSVYPCLLGVFGLLSVIFYVNISNFSIIDRYVARPNLNSAQAKNILQHLLRNVYRSFNFKNESLVYDKLHLSLSGSVLEKVYLQYNDAMRLKKLGGASANVSEVKLLSIKKIRNKNNNLQAFLCSWVVLGKVGHWGHIHYRKNQYNAVVYFGPSKQYWKIFDIESISESRLQ